MRLPRKVRPFSFLNYSWNHSKSTRASWCVTNTDTQTITPLRGFRLNLSLRGATHDRHERDTTHDEHHGPAMPTAHSLRRRAHTRGRVRGGIFFSGRRRRVVVGGALFG